MDPTPEEIGRAVRRVFGDVAPHLALAAEVNRALHGRWHIWFVSLGGRVEWLAAPVNQAPYEVTYPAGEPMLTAWEPIGLLCQICNLDGDSLPLLLEILATLRSKPMAPGGGVTGSH